MQQVVAKIENDPDCYQVIATGKAVQSAEIEFSINGNYTLNKHSKNLAAANLWVQEINQLNVTQLMVQIKIKN